MNWVGGSNAFEGYMEQRETLWLGMNVSREILLSIFHVSKTDERDSSLSLFWYFLETLNKNRIYLVSYLVILLGCYFFGSKLGI